RPRCRKSCTSRLSTELSASVVICSPPAPKRSRLLFYPSRALDRCVHVGHRMPISLQGQLSCSGRPVACQALSPTLLPGAVEGGMLRASRGHPVNAVIVEGAWRRVGIVHILGIDIGGTGIKGAPVD